MTPNGYLIFEDDSFLDSTVAKMNALRKSGQFCDVRLQVCGHELMAHRAVLACCSPYLFEVFNGDSEPVGGVSLVKFDDLTPEAVEILLNYAYTAQLKADTSLVRDVYSAAKKLKMERVKQICGDYLLSKMDSQSAIPYRDFASSMGDGRLLGKIDGYIQEHLLELSEQEHFLKLPRLKVQTLYYSADHKLHDGNLLEGQVQPSEGLGCGGVDDEHIQFVQKKAPRESVHCQHFRHEWKYIASEKTSNSTYLCLAVLNGVLCVVFLHGRASPHCSPYATPCLTKSLSLENQLSQGAEKEDRLEERLLTRMHYARSGLGTAELNGRLIAAGGYNREECLRTVECYDPKKDCWTFIAPMRTPRARFQMAVLMGQLYVMGGSNGHSDELSCGETYDPRADEWTQVPELRTNRCNAGVCALNNKLFVVGGSDPCGQKGLKNCDAFDPVAKTWNNCAPLNIRRHQAAACELDGFMYVIGGAESWNCLNSVERYNPENNTWTLVAPMNVARRGAAVTVHNGKLFVVGGFDGTHALHCVEVYDPARNEWKMLGSMTSARSNAGVAVLGGVVCAVGGFDGNDFLNTVEAYESLSNEWSPCGEAFKQED
uniref:BTB domain-containing protein n=1 Tax=Esox lucius TaxID=8010 RepID=A0A6Q2XWT3_ESOLU